ncbi:TrkH family potassium uptake protein [Futiania mangrovi]|uniref:Trk system potassium uptake protein n=1 Tax=Futiania mangrovi TaxID=2959716 RepID=A0A9J6PK60_9PROT|nr:TrkH family potassium uptake protein [Futiania mangrovii]MCP1336458.1 TrkH family potassium uptake protein [Futiania mangrovii]
MTFGIVTLAIGYLLSVLGVAMIVPALVDLASNHADWQSFAVSALLTLFAAGTLILASHGGPRRMTLRQGFLLTVMAWLTASVFAALPFLFSDLGIHFVDAFFEAISGLTTTGATVLTGLETLPPGILVWRSMLQWIGGLGIVAMGIVMLPFLRIGGMQLFRLESTDRTSDKILPRPAQLAATIGAIYVLMSLTCALLYFVLGMSGFDALNHAMTTVATAGYSTYDASLGQFQSAPIYWTATVFMLLGSLPFNVYIAAVTRDPRLLVRDVQVRGFLLMVAAIWIGLTGWRILAHEIHWFDALTEVAVNTTSIITTTGYATTDFTAWGPVAMVVFFMLLFLGGCAGSTTGGFKIYRLQITVAMVAQALRRTIMPHGVFRVEYGGHPVDSDVRESVAMFAMLYALTMAVLAVLLAFCGLDFITAVSGAVSAVANVGPGVGEIIGPAGNYSTVPDAAKWLLSLGMLLGRLEIVTVLVLLSTLFWQR